jgi:hypothetical protein
MFRLLAILAVLLAAAAPLTAQSPAPPADAFLDPTAARLVERALAARGEVDAAIASYSATVRQRLAVGLRMPIRDRTLYSRESAQRVWWQRDGRSVVELLAAREQHPGGVTAPLGVDGLYDPTGDRMHFGLGGSDDGWIHHPLADSGPEHYRYRSGDTLRMAFPDGRRLTAIELQILPRQRTSRAVAGVLWIEESSGSLVQAAFRLAREFDYFRDDDSDDDLDMLPGIFRPLTFDVSLLVVEYSLWHFRHWMPRVLRFEGMAQAGSMLRVPFTAEIAYDVHDVRSDPVRRPELAQAAADSILEARAGEGRRTVRRRTSNTSGGRTAVSVIRPAHRDSLLTSPMLPPPIWARAPEFVTVAELESVRRALESIPLPGQPRIESDLAFGWQRSDLMRYNRVEGLSLGARATAVYEPLTATATVRMGAADRHPNAALAVQNDARRHTVGIALEHGLRSVEEDGRAFGLGASLGALLLGRDDGDYYRATSLRMRVAPGTVRRAAWDGWVELARHRSAQAETDWSIPALWGSRDARPNIAAEEGTLLRAGAALRPWWGADPARAQAGLDARAELGTGDFEYARASLVLRGAAPLGRRHRVGIELGAGSSEGQLPLQRHFFMGGPSTLRGYGGAAAVGTSFGRARLELGRGSAGIALALFGDAAWAGHRNSIHERDVLYSAGVGASLLDGLLRFDLARPLRGPRALRLEIHLDAVL